VKKNSVATITLTVLLVLSLGWNVYCGAQKTALEEKVWMTKWRLAVFARATSNLINEKASLTFGDVTAPKMIGYPYETGEGYVLDKDPHFGVGIKYIFNKTGKLIAWEECPKIHLQQDAGNGKLVSRDTKDVIYDQDTCTK
jgi:hypothetical protein